MLGTIKSVHATSDRGLERDAARLWKCCRQVLSVSYFSRISPFKGSLTLQQAIRDALSRLDEMNATELGEQLTKYEVKAPDTKNDISQPFPFNLMFKTSIGPRGDSIGYLRPETAQGIFVNFRYLTYEALIMVS